MNLICRLIFALVLLSGEDSEAAFVDAGPPTDVIGNWKVDLYDASNNQRGASATPFYVLSPGVPATLGQKASAASTSVVIATEQANALSTAARQDTGNTYLSQIATNTASALTDVTASGTITAANGTVVLAAQGVYTVSASITGTWAGTIIFEGQLADSTWVQVPFYLHTASLPYAVGGAATTNGTYMISGGGYLNVRARASAYTSGTIAVAMDGSLAQQTNLVPPGGATSALQTAGNNILSAIQSVLNSILTAVASPNDSVRPTYSGVSATFAFATNPTDIFTVSGSASKVVRLVRIAFTATQTTGAQRDVFIIKRSTASSGGTSTAIPLTPHDSAGVAATGTARVYTANPTLGTQVAIIRARKVYIGTTSQNSDELILDFGANNSQPIVLRGVAESLSINLNGVSSAGGQADISVTTTEDAQ